MPWLNHNATGKRYALFSERSLAMNAAETSPQPGLREPQSAAAPPTATKTIIDRAACIAWLLVDCARDHRPAARQERRGPVPSRRGPLPDRRQLATHSG